MLGFRRGRAERDDLIARFHAAIVAASRAPSLYGPGGFPDTLEGRFESLTLHVLLVLRRLRALPAPAGDVAQDLVDAVFAHLEIAMRESGVGDFGVPKKMKKLGQAFYDRTAKYEPAIAAGPEALAAAIAVRAEVEPASLARIPAYLAEAEAALASRDLAGLLHGPVFAPAAAEFAAP